MCFSLMNKGIIIINIIIIIIIITFATTRYST